MTELVMSRQFSAPRTAVWAAFVEPEIISQWWGPHGWAIEEDSIVFEPMVGAMTSRIGCMVQRHVVRTRVYQSASIPY